jgi:hypothetical protein
MKISASLLQAISLALIIPCATSCIEKQPELACKKPLILKDSQRVKAPVTDSLKSALADTVKVNSNIKTAESCPPCGKG